jgi:hypothetical protein
LIAHRVETEWIASKLKIRKAEVKKEKGQKFGIAKKSKI